MRKFYPWYLERLDAPREVAERLQRIDGIDGGEGGRRGAGPGGPRVVSLTPRVEEWRARGADEDVAGRRIHVFRRDGDGPLLLLLHGFPSSSYDWRLLLDEVSDRRVLAYDCLGFGLSEKPADHDYTLVEQADIAVELVNRHHPGEPVFLVGHDMGTSVANELMARDIDGRAGIDIRGALLFNGSMIQGAASPTLAQRLLRRPLRPGDGAGSRASASSASSSARSSPRATR